MGFGLAAGLKKFLDFPAVPDFAPGAPGALGAPVIGGLVPVLAPPVAPGLPPVVPGEPGLPLVDAAFPCLAPVLTFGLLAGTFSAAKLVGFPPLAEANWLLSDRAIRWFLICSGVAFICCSCIAAISCALGLAITPPRPLKLE